MRSTICKRDWINNGIKEFIKGKEYPVIKFEKELDRINGVQLVGENELNVWFWNGSDYFDMPIL